MPLKRLAPGLAVCITAVGASMSSSVRLSTGVDQAPAWMRQTPPDSRLKPAIESSSCCRVDSRSWSERNMPSQTYRALEPPWLTASTAL
ncbi:hypothetical protein D3C85_605850 [compost metagenome]